RKQLEIIAGVGGAKGARVEHVYGIECDRIGEDVRVVPGTLPEAVIGIDPHPAVATVVGTEHPALLRLDGGVDAVGVRGGHRHPDAAERPVAQAVVLADVTGEAAVAIGDVAARAGLAGADIDDVVIRVGDRDRSYRGDLLLVEDRLPRAAGVGALPDPTGHRTEIPGRRIPRHAAHRHHPAAAER